MNQGEHVEDLTQVMKSLLGTMAMTPEMASQFHRNVAVALSHAFEQANGAPEMDHLVDVVAKELGNLTLHPNLARQFHTEVAAAAVAFYSGVTSTPRV